MTASSSVEICNLSFDLLRHKEKVSDIETNPTNDAEALAARWYDVTRRACLGAYPWNFARKRAVLSLNSTAPEFGYANAYDLPSNYVGLVFVGDNYEEDYETEYAIEGNQLLIDNDDATSLNICYIQDIVNVVRFDPLFVEYLVAELAIRFGNSITGLNKGLKDIYAWKKDLEARARTKNGKDNPPKVRLVSPMKEKRQQAISGSNTTDGVHLF